MGQSDIRPGADGELLVSGAMVYSSAPLLLAQGEALFAGQDSLTVDLAGVDRCDSSGLALLLEWLDRGRAAGVRIRYRNIPEALLGIARLSNVDSLLAGGD